MQIWTEKEISEYVTACYVDNKQLVIATLAQLVGQLMDGEKTGVRLSRDTIRDRIHDMNKKTRRLFVNEITNYGRKSANNKYDGKISESNIAKTTESHVRFKRMETDILEYGLTATVNKSDIEQYAIGFFYSLAGRPNRVQVEIDRNIKAIESIITPVIARNIDVIRTGTHPDDYPEHEGTYLDEIISVTMANSYDMPKSANSQLEELLTPANETPEEEELLKQFFFALNDNICKIHAYLPKDGSIEDYASFAVSAGWIDNIAEYDYSRQ